MLYVMVRASTKFITLVTIKCVFCAFFSLQYAALLCVFFNECFLVFTDPRCLQH